MIAWTDKHYNYTHKLTPKDIEAGEIRVDAYFVAKAWKTGSKDDSGALWHCLKTIARFGDKNPVEREIKAMYAQVKRLAELNGVVLEMTEKVSVSEKDLWYPDPGEWIEYDGSGECPCEKHVRVEVLLEKERGTQMYDGLESPASSWDWIVDSYDSKIVAYKIVK